MVVISPKRRNVDLVTVVPLSSTPPTLIQPWHHQLSPGAYPPARGPVWVKADVVATVALARLDRVKVKTPGGTRSYQTFQLQLFDMAAIYTAVKAALGLP